MKRASLTIGLAAAIGLSACSKSPAQAPPAQATRHYALKGPLVPATVNMMAAWDVPMDPLTDASLDASARSDEIRWGFKLFTNTPAEAPRFTGGRVSCTNCHLNAGQRERALPLVGIAGVFPEYNKRAGRPFTLEDRVVDCFLRSENATGRAGPRDLPTPASREVAALAAYVRWLSRGYEGPKAPSWRGENTIATRIPVERLDPAKGQALYTEHCTNCHGSDGQGVTIGDKRAGPLWGPDSWNDGAGAARVYTLAGMIRHMMPYLNPGSLTDEEAQQIAAFITAKPRPAYPFKAGDYKVDPLPPDAVYYRQPRD